MVNTLAKRAVDPLKARNKLIATIDDLWSHYQAGIQQVNRRYYHRMGEAFMKLRKTFAKGHMGDVEFNAFCKEHWSQISVDQRQSWTTYRKRLGPLDSSRQLPTLRTEKEYQKQERRRRIRSSYKQIVDEEMGETPEHFEIPRSEKDVENELVAELALKIISAGFRVLSVKMHPDREGGSNEAQRRLNSAKTLLQDALSQQALRM
jgi:hypothetical protein